MDKTYIVALIDSLNQKVDVMNTICEKNAEQYALIKADIFSNEAFDRNSMEKGILIAKLNKLDDGFQMVYDKIRDELTDNKVQYSHEIRTMQELISIITDLSTKIQAEEARNKSALENHFAMERSKIRGARSQANAIKSYAKAMKSKPFN